MPSNIIFYPLDITYKVKNEKASIYIYGKSHDGKQVCVTVQDFQPYFCVKPKGSHLQLVEDLKSLKVIYGKSETAEVTDVKEIEKKLYGKNITLLKVYTKLPSHVPAIKKEVEDHPSVEACFEYDILFTKRYLIDSEIKPLRAAKAFGDFTGDPSRVPVFQAESITPAADEDLQALNVLSFDIETYNPDGRGIDTAKNPIIMIAMYGIINGQEFKEVITWRNFSTEQKYIELVSGEAALIERFKEVITELRPDILVGYYSDGFDLPYIIDRAKRYGIKLDLGYDYSEPSVNRRANEVRIAGMIHLDILSFIRRILFRTLETDDLKLDSVASELLGENKHKVDLDSLAYVWDNNPEKLEPFCVYNLQDAQLTYKLCMKLLPNMEEMVRIVGLPIFEVSRMSYSQLVESYIFTQCRLYNEIAPNKPDGGETGRRRFRTYEGAFVFQPVPGLYDNVVIFDFRSLYPSIITSHNISPGSLRCSCCTEKIPGEEDWFCTKKKGFLPSVLESIITRRMQIKDMINFSKENNKLLNARSEALKLLANSFYGYLGFAPARWYSFESAKAITALGRHHIHEVIDNAQKNGFAVIYSDTDSIFLQLKEKTKHDALSFVEEINRSLPGLMELEYKGFYPSALFVGAKASGLGAKKKYALLTGKGDLKIKGFEAIRRNCSFIAKEAQEKVLEIILKEKDAKKALSYVKEVVKNIRAHTVPADQVAVATQLTMPTSYYKNLPPHVAVAKRMEEKGLDVAPGTIIYLVICEGKGILRDRAYASEELHDKKYDADYYIKHQIIPSVERIFAVLSINIEEEFADYRQKSLGDFFGKAVAWPY